MRSLPDFEPLPDTVDIPRGDVQGKDIAKTVGVWAGSRRTYPVGSQEAIDAWWQPFVAVGSSVIWTGPPLRDSEAATTRATAELVSAMRQLFTSRPALALGTLIGGGPCD